MDKRIEITVSKDGKTKVETKGFAGAACKSASAPYEQALGLTTNEVHTAEYFESSESSEQAENRT